MFLHHPQHRVVAAALENGQIGTPRHFFGEFTYPMPPANDMRLNPELSGGVFHDSAGYPVAAVLELFKTSPEGVLGYQGLDRQIGVDDTFSAILDFGDGRSANVFTAFGVHYRSRYAVTGTKGRIEVQRAFAVQPDAETRIVIETDQGLETIVVPPANQFLLALDDFCAAVAGNKDSTARFQDGMMQRHAVMDAIAQSIQTGRRVLLSDVSSFC